MHNLEKVVGVRVTENLYAKIRDVSEARGEDASDFIRRAILKELASLSFLSEEQKKALGLNNQKAPKSGVLR
jgi:Arc/MetJ-type ribon-helix-helix transcriptional regulator